MQGYRPGSYDVLLASHVLHASQDVASALQNCKALLRSGGLFLANEHTTKTEFLTLTTDLTTGWWQREDNAIRIAGSSLINRSCNNPFLPAILAIMYFQVASQCGSLVTKEEHFP